VSCCQSNASLEEVVPLLSNGNESCVCLVVKAMRLWKKSFLSCRMGMKLLVVTVVVVVVVVVVSVVFLMVVWWLFVFYGPSVFVVVVHCGC
jgi:hypothetical protein